MISVDTSCAHAHAAMLLSIPFCHNIEASALKLQSSHRQACSADGVPLHEQRKAIQEW